jgi:hypothetical protein
MLGKNNNLIGLDEFTNQPPRGWYWEVLVGDEWLPPSVDSNGKHWGSSNCRVDYCEVREEALAYKKHWPHSRVRISFVEYL